MPSPHLPLRPSRWLAALLALLLGGPAQAASAVLIWPINPAIEADQPARRCGWRIAASNR